VLISLRANDIHRADGAQRRVLCSISSHRDASALHDVQYTGYSGRRLWLHACHDLIQTECY